MWANPHDPISQALQSTPEGQHALALDQQFGVKLHIGQPGAGSGYQRKTNTVTLEPGRSAEQIQKSYIHEMTHARYHHEGRTADLGTLPLDEYVEKMLEEEAEAEGNAIRHHLRMNREEPPTHLEKEYVHAYEQGVAHLKNRDPHATPLLLHEAGQKQARARLVEAFKSGEVLTSTTQESYQQYYEKLWHKQIRTAVLNVETSYNSANSALRNLPNPSSLPALPDFSSLK
jgi:hypothetical protein